MNTSSGAGIQTPDEDVAAAWNDVQNTIAHLKSEYRENGSTVMSVIPGDIIALTDKPNVNYEFDVLTPTNKYRTIDEWIRKGVEFSSFELHKKPSGSATFCIVVLRDNEHILIFPVYYYHTERSKLISDSKAAGAVRINVHQLSGEGVRIELDPDEFFTKPEIP